MIYEVVIQRYTCFYWSYQPTLFLIAHYIYF